MANLDTLLTSRNLVRRRGIERAASGDIFYFTHTNVGGTINYTPCTYTWVSPGTGTAIIELWGAGGTGGLQCCCHSGGIPGNPGGYTKITVGVTASSCVCGWVGCSPHGNCLCYPGRSECSTACLFGTTCNNVLTAQGGFGGYIMCSTSTSMYCCMVGQGFFHTLSGSNFCGIICNWGGPNSACFACSCGGELNVCGGISCSNFWDCCQYHKCNIEHTVALPPGISASCCSTCVRFSRSEFPGYGIANNGWAEYSQAVGAMQGATGQRHFCWNSNQPCGCYEYDGCKLNAAAFPGLSGIPCPNVRSGGHKGGHGAIKVTFYAS